jgi:HEAT repeat protein
VRRAAFEAALERPDAGDLPHALEALRLDPDPLVQSLAARLAGVIGGEDSVLGLRDRFERADENNRLSIVDAWAMPKAYRAGGERELRRTLEGNLELVSVAAARALLGHGQRDAAVLGVLEHGIRQGTDIERRLAIAAAPTTEPSIVEALLAASNDGEPSVAAPALERLAALGKHRSRAFRELRQRARVRGEQGNEARAALSRLGDRSIVPALVKDVQSGGAYRRQASALELFDLGEPGLAARALADADPGVRTSVACGVLARKPRG